MFKMNARIHGSELPLVGTININGSKHAALPIIAATLLTTEPVQLLNIPNIEDVSSINKLLTGLGASVDFQVNSEHSNHTLTINCSDIASFNPCPIIAKKFRASFLLLGPLLARFGRARIAFPGGCNLGNRAVDFHINAFQKMGVQFLFSEENNCLEAKVTNKNGRFQGTTICFHKPSVGATANILMAATLAENMTIIRNASMEPEIVDLARFLVQLGAKIKGIGSKELIIQGVSKLRGCNSYSIIPDRIEAGTYAIAAILTAGRIELKGINKKQLGSIVIKKLVEAGGEIKCSSKSSIIISRQPENPIKPILISTNPYPKFPTDLQPQFCTLLSLAQSESQIPVSVVQENVFDGRFRHVFELRKLGAKIEFLKHQHTQYKDLRNIELTKLYSAVREQEEESISINSIAIFGSSAGLSGNIARAYDLRGAAALILAGLVAKGETIVEDIHHLIRGYESMDLKLNGCGANIEFLS